MTIYKYSAAIHDERAVDMPSGAEILCVQVQGGEPFVWAKVAVSTPTVKRIFRWRATGQQADGLGVYVGTIQLHGGGLVFHLFVDRETP